MICRSRIEPPKAKKQTVSPTDVVMRPRRKTQSRTGVASGTHRTRHARSPQTPGAPGRKAAKSRSSGEDAAVTRYRGSTASRLLHQGLGVEPDRLSVLEL